MKQLCPAESELARLLETKQSVSPVDYVLVRGEIIPPAKCIDNLRASIAHVRKVFEQYDPNVEIPVRRNGLLEYGPVVWKCRITTDIGEAYRLTKEASATLRTKGPAATARALIEKARELDPDSSDVWLAHHELMLKLGVGATFDLLEAMQVSTMRLRVLERRLAFLGMMSASPDWSTYRGLVRIRTREYKEEYNALQAAIAATESLLVRDEEELDRDREFLRLARTVEIARWWPDNKRLHEIIRSLTATHPCVTQLTAQITGQVQRRIHDKCSQRTDPATVKATVLRVVDAFLARTDRWSTLLTSRDFCAYVRSSCWRDCVAETLSEMFGVSATTIPLVFRKWDIERRYEGQHKRKCPLAEALRDLGLTEHDHKGEEILLTEKKIKAQYVGMEKADPPAVRTTRMEDWMEDIFRACDGDDAADGDNSKAATE